MFVGLTALTNKLVRLLQQHTCQALACLHFDLILFVPWPPLSLTLSNISECSSNHTVIGTSRVECFFSPIRGIPLFEVHKPFITKTELWTQHSNGFKQLGYSAPLFS